MKGGKKYIHTYIHTYHRPGLGGGVLDRCRTSLAYAGSTANTCLFFRRPCSATGLVTRHTYMSLVVLPLLVLNYVSPFLSLRAAPCSWLPQGVCLVVRPLGLWTILLPSPCTGVIYNLGLRIEICCHHGQAHGLFSRLGRGETSAFSVLG